MPIAITTTQQQQQQQPNGLAGKLKLNGPIAHETNGHATAQDNSKNRQAVQSKDGDTFVDPYNYVVSLAQLQQRMHADMAGRSARRRPRPKLPVPRPAP